MGKLKMKRTLKRAVALLLTAVMLLGEGSGFGAAASTVMAAEDSTAGTVITKIEPYPGNTQVIEKTGVSGVSFGFNMPEFNGVPYTQVALTDVQKDLELQVDVDGTWTNIDDVAYFQFNSTWGWEYQVWSDTAAGWICWFKINETTRLRFHGITNDVNLEYTLKLNKLSVLDLTSITAKESRKEADATGGSAIDWTNYIFNGDEGITYAQIENDVEILVDNGDGKGFVPLLANAASGFIWDSNFGIYTDGNGGLWFKNIGWSFTVRLKKRDSDTIFADVYIHYTEPDRSVTTLSAFDGKTRFDANENKAGSIGIVMPKINNTNAVSSDLAKFQYQVKDDKGNWIGLGDADDWIYQDSGYNKYSNKQQWGYFVDTVYGLWMQPVLKDTEFRIGYPDNSNSDVIVNNWVYYTIIGNPDAEVPDVSDMTPITVDNEGEPSGDVTTVTEPEGWKLIWNDEFNGTSVNSANWSNQTGFFVDETDYNTAGWGNSELEYYTDSPENTSVANGTLKLTLKKQKQTFYDTQGRPAEGLYSSGKLISQNKFSVKYGRVDFRAKLPDGNGIWPALWMMPNDDIYGTWACSGEIDVFEGRGRTPEMAYGTLHYGGMWPGDLESGDKMNMTTTEGVGSDMTNWHVYSLVWEEGKILMYVDGICYMKREADSWNTVGAPDNPNAPFDQRFYLIHHFTTFL